MTATRKLLGNRSVLLILMISVLLISASCVRDGETTRIPKAVDGVLDLRRWDFASGPIDLAGEWEFYWKALYESTEPGLGTTIQPDGLFEVPASWSGHTLPDGRRLDPFGYATLRLRVLLPESPSPHPCEPLQIYLKYASTAYALQVFDGAGNPLAAPIQGGVVGTDPASHRPERYPDTATVPPAPEWVIVWRISNFQVPIAGPENSPRLGSEGQLRRELETRQFTNSLSIGVLLVMGIYHLVLFALRPRERAPLWFGLICLELALRAIATERYIELMFPGRDVWRLDQMAEILSFYLAIPTFALFIRSMFPEQATGKFFWAVIAIGAVCSSAVLVTPAMVYLSLLNFYLVFTAISLGWGFYVLIRAVRSKNPLAWWIMAGFIVLALSVVNDLLKARMLIATPFISQYGLSIFILFQSIVIALVNQKAHRAAETLAADLAQSEKKYRTLFEDSRDAIFIATPDGALIDANQATLDLFGYSSEEMMRLDVRDTFTNLDDRPRFQQAIEQSGSVRDFEVQLSKKDGTVMDCLLAATVRRARDGGILAYQGIIRDVTERKRAQEMLEAYSRTLEQSVQQRTVELTRAIEQLEQEITDRRQAEEAMRRHNEYLEALHVTALGLISRFDINYILETIVVRAGQLLGTSHGYIFLDGSTNGAAAELECKVCTGVFRPLLGSRSRPGQGMVGQVWQTGKSLVVDDYDAWSDRSPNFDHGIVRAVIGVPLTQSTESQSQDLEPERDVVGVLGMAYGIESKRTFGDEEIELLGRFAELASIALDNARLYAETQERARRLALLHEISMAVNASLDLTVTLTTACRELVKHFPDCDHSGVLLFDEAYTYGTVIAEFPDQNAVGARIAVQGNPSTQQVIETAQPLAIYDAQHDPLMEPSHEVMRSLGVQSILIVPLLVEGRVIGTVGLDALTTSHHFAPAEIALAQTIAAQLAMAVTNARLFGEAERRVAELATLTDVGQALSSTLRVDEALQLIYEQTRRVMYAENMIIMLYDQEHHEIVCGFSNNPDDAAPGARFPGDSGLTGHIVERRASLLLHSDEDERELGLESVGMPSSSWLGVPMLAGDRVLGVIIVQHYTTPNVYDKSHQVLLETIASQAAIAIQNAYLFEEIQREKQYSESLILNSPIAIVVEDSDHKIVTWNPAAEELFGYTRTETIGRDIDNLISTETRRAEALAYTRQVIEGNVVRAVTQRSRKDGTLVDVELLGVPLHVAGERVGSLVIYHDITELQRARHEAEAANRAKSAFLATMSHEIRTPMNAVIGMTSLLLDTDLTAEQREFTQTIRISGDALLTIINDVLDFSKIEAGRMDLESQPFDLRECVESAIDLFTTEAAKKGLEMACLIDAQAPAAIVGDVTRLRQILINLIGNAIKFTERGEVVVQARSRNAERGVGSRETDLPAEHPPLLPTPRSASLLHFSIRDTGIGIPPDRMDRLFQSFSQVDTSTTRRYGGTGLGLAISKRLCELMGGAMWVESPPPSVPPIGGEERGGLGSTFHFTIQAETALRPIPTYLQKAQPDLRGRRVLIVDDNDTNRRILTLQTKRWGMLSRDTASPAEALAWIRQEESFDVALLDMQMPEMDGLMLADEIQRERDANASASASLPLVMLTSLGQQEVETEGAFAAFLTKPAKASQLYDVLVDIFAQEEPARKTRDAAAPPPFDPEMGKRLPLRILLAEDNAVNQKLALHLLKRMGYRADMAANGLEALEAVRRQTYDAVLMDVQMPEMDGLEATRRIRQELEESVQPRIVAMTAGAMKENREECLAAGMDDYISKPIQVEELIGALRKCQPVEQVI